MIIASDFGTFPIMFTDSRCPDDGVPGEVTFVDQPDLIINPEFPDFCVESDSLLLSLNVSGNSTGQFFWSVNGETQNTFGPTLDFAPMEFEPLETYEISVIGFDNFGVCNVATGGITFVGEWCTYHLPNVVTPNGDGVNDLFTIEFAEFFPQASLRIFNRWGIEVFSQENYDQYQERTGGWDPGDLSEGVYFIELRLPTLNKVETGNLTILRDAKAGR
jgi:gliding motility-associated-like protein